RHTRFSRDWSSDVCSSDLTEGSVPLANPLSAELGVMRTQLLPGLVDALSRNAARQQSRIRLFEIGKVFHATEAGAAPRETVRIEIGRASCRRRDEESTVMV